MRFSRVLASVFGLAVLLAVLSIISSPAAAQRAVTVPLQRLGSSSFASAPMATDVSGLPDEIDDAVNGDDADTSGSTGTGIAINRSLPGTITGQGKPVSSKPKSKPVLGAHFQGLNFHDQRFANGGNQFSVEPPDQSLCAGNGFELEAVNDVLNVFNTAGQSVLPDNTATNIVGGFPPNVNHAVDLNSFYGYPPAINRSTGVRGQFVTDPSCLYDAQTNR